MNQEDFKKTTGSKVSEVFDIIFQVFPEIAPDLLFWVVGDENLGNN